MKKSLNYIIFLFIILIVAFFWQLGNPNQKPKDEINEGDVINVIFLFDNEAPVQLEYPYSIAKPDNLFVITKNLAQEQNWAFNFERYESMGIIISQIGDKANGENQKYWQYTANGLTPLISVDNFYPQPNDTVEWVFKESEL